MFFCLKKTIIAPIRLQAKGSQIRDKKYSFCPSSLEKIANSTIRDNKTLDVLLSRKKKKRADAPQWDHLLF